MAELLLELLSEEIPARMQAKAAADLKRLVTDGLKKARLDFDGAEAFVTPRRLALVVEGLPTVQPDITVERKGPKVGAPEKATEGFLKSAGLDSLDQCEVREVKGAEFYFIVEKKEGGSIETVFVNFIPRVVWSFPWPKSMRWADGRARYVRPLHNIVLLFNGKLIQTSIAMEGSITQNTSNRTVGHRFLAPDEIEVKNFTDYRDGLRAAFVMLDAGERQQTIRDGAARLAQAEGLVVKPDEALVAENAGLVEWPLALLGRIDAAFMELPGEVLSSAMRKHQKYFSLEDRDGKLAPRFVMVANMVTEDNGAAIVAGNERVLRARLADAKFFWDQDRKQTLAGRLPALKHIVFHAKLGTLDEKVDRIQKLAVELCRYIPGAERDRVRSAARLCKADLSTEMVGEFPDLQGVMGCYYALADGEVPEVAQAIREHYAPLGPNDRCPSAPESVAVALADKIDTLFWFFAIGQRPTGSKDPFGLRRAALGVIRLILENELRVRLSELLDSARRKGPGQESRHSTVDRSRRTQGVIDQLLDFFADRLKVHLRETGVRHDLVSAVFALGGEDDLLRLMARVEALGNFLGGEDGVHLLTAYRRAANILRIEEKKDGASYAAAPDTALFAEKQERGLNDCIRDVNRRARAALDREAFEDAMAIMSGLRGPIDEFFDRVTVNADDAALRRNRLNLLSEIRDSLDRIADFSKIEG